MIASDRGHPSVVKVLLQAEVAINTTSQVKYCSWLRDSCDWNWDNRHPYKISIYEYNHLFTSITLHLYAPVQNNHPTKRHTLLQILCLFENSSYLLLVSKQGLLIKHTQELANTFDSLLVPSALLHWWAGIATTDCMVANCFLVVKKYKKKLPGRETLGLKYYIPRQLYAIMVLHVFISSLWI